VNVLERRLDVSSGSEAHATPAPIDLRWDGEVVVVGNYGNRNLGDEATLSSLLHHLRRRRPQVRATVVSFDPSDTERRHGVTAVPARAGRRSGGAGGFGRVSGRVRQSGRQVSALWLKARALAKADWLIFGGGGQIDDQFGGAWGAPRRLFGWTAAARLAGCRVAFLNVGAGPLDSPVSRLLSRWALSLASIRTYRDEDSRALVERLGVAGPHHVAPDLAFGLPTSPRVTSNRTRPRVVVNLFPHQDDRYLPKSERRLFDQYLSTMTAFVRWLTVDHEVVLMPTQLRADPPMIDDLLARLDARSRTDLRVASVATCDDLMAELQQADYLVASRFHGILLGLSQGLPVLALSNHPKVDALMRDLGESQHLLHIDRMTVEDLQSAFRTLASGSPSIRLDAIRASRAEAVRAEFDALLPAAGPV
jgi:polysaccharide pyruvyl transferase WcaK-like protein